MQKTFICQGCGQEKQANLRLKGIQGFCGEPDCQRARKAQWQKDQDEDRRRLPCPRAGLSERVASKASTAPLSARVSRNAPARGCPCQYFDTTYAPPCGAGALNLLGGHLQHGFLF